jgi:hypothetical protein
MSSLNWDVQSVILAAGVKTEGFVGSDSELFWSAGVLEYWSIEIKRAERWNTGRLEQWGFKASFLF